MDKPRIAKGSGKTSGEWTDREFHPGDIPGGLMGTDDIEPGDIEPDNGVGNYGRGRSDWVDPTPVGDDHVLPNNETIIEHLNRNGFSDIDHWMRSEGYESEDGQWYGPDGDTINPHKTYLAGVQSAQFDLDPETVSKFDAVFAPQAPPDDESWINDAEAANASVGPPQDYNPAKERFQASVAGNKARSWSPAPVPGAQVGNRSPWGTIDGSERIGDGIYQVYTPGHGGIVVSKERNEAIHPAWRNADRCYEEDCEWSKVVVTFPDEFDNYDEAANRAAKDWYPDEYEKVTGETIAPGESYTRTKNEQEVRNKDRLSAMSAVNSSTEKGMVEVTVRRGGRTDHGRGPTTTILVPAADYKAVPVGEFAVDDDHGYAVIERNEED